MAGALNRMRNRKLSQAWEQWQFWYEEVKEQQFKLAGALRRMMNRKLSQAWESWQAWYEELLRQQQLIKRGLMRMLKRKLAQALTTWRLVTAYILHIFNRAARRWRNRALGAAFNTWRDKCKQKDDANYIQLEEVDLEADGILLSQHYPLCSPLHPKTMADYVNNAYVPTYPSIALSLTRKDGRVPYERGIITHKRP